MIRIVAVAVASTLACAAGAGADSPCTIPSTAQFLEPQAPDPSYTFGTSVAVEGDWVAVGVPGSGQTVAGRVELFHRVGREWAPAGILAPSDGFLGDGFGGSLAMQGDTLLVGAPYSTGAVPKSGAAYVYRLQGATWQHEAKLLFADGTSSDYFGADVALDGDRALVGAHGRDDVFSGSGAAYLFERRGGRWVLEANLTAPDPAANDSFGFGVEIDEGIVAITVFLDDDERSITAGSVRVFEKGVSGWSQTANINAAETPFPAASGFFGTTVSLRHGTLLINANIGAPSSAGTLLEYVRAGAGWVGPRLVVAPGGEVRRPDTLRLGPTGDVAAWSARTPGGKGVIQVVHRDAAGWYSEHVVAAPIPIPAAALGADVAFDGETMITGRALVEIEGVLKGIAFVADLPPRDMDRNGLDDACEIELGLADDCDGDDVIDSAQMPFRYSADNVEVILGPTMLNLAAGGSVLILNHFATTGSERRSVESVGFVIPNLPSGSDPDTFIDGAIAVVYSDPDGDGNPADAELLSAQSVTFPPAPGYSIVTDIPIAPVDVGPPGTSCFVGFAMEVNIRQNFTQVDTALPHRQASWFVSDGTALVLDDLTQNPLQALDLFFDNQVASFVFPIRVNLTDCDGSQAIDGCEIAHGELEDLDGDQTPDICQPRPADLDGDGAVDGSDISALFRAWGPCPRSGACAEDLDGDGVVDGADLGIVLGAWTQPQAG